MILYRWRGACSNFGDELNTVLWPRLLPGLFDDNPAIRFLGIGSVLDQRHPSQATK
ncbi:MAG: exopolysaccharide glucosyl ketal-pyruvate-transferase, partial [Acetobacteraceae bacterium]|nr:exopolysaccharide glucosyl ketal-pyruvate-transferase [Acetobacteraceae bacterium]